MLGVLRLPLASSSELLASPSELLASPSELLASSSELLASPSELLASLRELLALQVSTCLVSASQGEPGRAAFALSVQVSERLIMSERSAEQRAKEELQRVPTE
jgi:hypothetical protein